GSSVLAPTHHLPRRDGGSARVRLTHPTKEHAMSTPSQPGNEGHKPKGEPQAVSQEFQIANIGARVPEKVSRGVFSTGVLVLQGASEFVLDFVLRMNQPHQIVARVILPMNLVPQLIEALKANLENYRKSFGAAPPAMPTPAPPPPPPAPPSS